MQMIKAAFFTSKPFLNNKQFNIFDKDFNRDNCLYPLYALKEGLKARGVDLSTQDINTLEESEIVIFNDMPDKLPTKKRGQRYYLIALESIAVNQRNYDRSLYGNFDKVFTWHDDLVDGVDVIKINYSFLFDPTDDLVPEERHKLVCLIANNKNSDYPNELYSERLKAIRWFENNHPEDFDLYGIGWDKHTFKGLFAPLNRSKFLRNLFKEKYPSYRGQIKVKKDVLSKYRFSICYENIKDIPGYITEKIFDSFFAACVPIYCGANNIQDYVPKQCFIDKNDFNTYEQLHTFIKSMSVTEYKCMRDEIKSYLNGRQSVAFQAKYFAETIVNSICQSTL